MPRHTYASATSRGAAARLTAATSKKGGRDRAYLRAQAQRLRRRRRHSYLDSDSGFLRVQYYGFVNLDTIGFRDGVDSPRLRRELGDLRRKLQANGQHGPLWSIPTTLLIELSPAARDVLVSCVDRPARVEQLDQRGRYRASERRKSLMEWDATRYPEHPSHRSRSAAAWRRDWLR